MDCERYRECTEQVTDCSKAAYVEGTVTFAFASTATPREPHRLLSPGIFRGLPLMLLHQGLKMFILSLFPAQGSSMVKCFLLSVIFESVLSPLKVAHVHKILNLHPQISLRQRIFNQSIWFDVFPATLLYSTVSSFSFYLIIYALRNLGFVDHEFTIVSRQIALCIVFALYGITHFGGTVPAYAVFMRVAASVDPTHDNPNHATRTMDIKGAWRSLSGSILALPFGVMYLVSVWKFLAAMCMGLFSLIYFPEHRYGEVGLFFAKYFG